MAGIFGVAAAAGYPSADLKRRFRAMVQALCQGQRRLAGRIEAFGDRAVLVGRAELPANCDEPQPVKSDDGQWAALVHGEVHDGARERAEICKGGEGGCGDARYLLEVFRRRGAEGLAGVSGSFVAAFVELATGRLCIACDRYGLRPLYLAQIGRMVVFAPQVAAVLAACPEAGAKIDHVAIAQFLAVGYPLGDRTFFEAIRLMPAAAVVELSRGRAEARRYWEFCFQPKPELADRRAQAKAVAEAVLRHTARISLHRAAGLRMGLLLSGGMDSRLIAGLVGRQRRVVAHHFSIQGCWETAMAREVARRCGMEFVWHEIRPEQLPGLWPEAVAKTDGMAGCEHLHFAGLAEAIGERSEVVLEGMGIDMLLGGDVPRWMLNWPADERIAGRVWRHIQKGAILQNGNHAGKLVRAPAAAEEAWEDFLSWFGACREDRAVDWYNHFKLRHEQRRLVASGGNYFATAARVVRPFYNNWLVEVALGLPVEARFRKRAYVGAFRLLLPELAGIACTTALGTGWRGLAQRAANRLRSEARRLAGWLIWPGRFWPPPYGEFLVRTWRRGFEALLADKGAGMFEIVDRRGLEEAWRARLGGWRGADSVFLRVLAVEVWCRLFLKREAVGAIAERFRAMFGCGGAGAAGHGGR